MDILLEPVQLDEVAHDHVDVVAFPHNDLPFAAWPHHHAKTAKHLSFWLLRPQVRVHARQI